MKKTDLAYFAGLFDGEGCISIDKDYKGKVYLTLSCRVAMTNLWVLQALKFAFGGSVRSVKKQKNHWKQAWIWRVSAQLALSFLEQILPYLKLKKPEAEIAIKFARAKMGRQGKRRLSDEQIAVAQAQQILVQNLKK